MSTFSHMLRPATARHLFLVDSQACSQEVTEEARFRAGNDLGALRGLAFAVVCNIIFAAIAIAGWQLWRLLR